MALAFRFGTVGSPIGTPKKPGGSVGALQFSQSIGLDAMELGWVQSVRVSVETCAAIREAASAAEVALSVHAPYFINLNAGDDEWPKSRQRLMDAAHFGYLAGATRVYGDGVRRTGPGLRRASRSGGLPPARRAGLNPG